ncbi:hypothetical protein OG562_25670 [Streptomyces sp. NBC_01275]|uniref:hypothetical protein n=1 Tax=Streptomyces sp. NBC_01275 TaxID=2903807 RepID=UPI00224FB0B3|nr:hypothetical protein [Streptomyces sp. NBC_01275]MCX4764287.1 hypothetical protein [Streptomyces sp. NBC_01275]
MSTAYAGTDLFAVVPDVSAYGSTAAQPDVANLAMPDTGSVSHVTDAATGHVTDAVTSHASDAVAHAGDAVGHAVDHATDVLADQLHDMIVPALIGLADLSGALLVTRLAVRGTVALAAFNNKVAADQEALARRQMSLENGSECWRRAAEAAAGLNARITVLGLGPAGGPGDPPLPAPVQPVGVPLDLLWKRLAETERALRRVEAQRASRTTARLPFQHTEDPERADWYDRLREQRRRALKEYAEGGAAPGSATAATPAAETGAPDTPPAAALTEEDVLSEGARLLAGLPLSFTSESRELIDDCLLEARRAVTRRPTAVRRYLDEAAIIAQNESARARRSEEARRDAALRLQALQAPAPEGVDPLPQAPAAVAVLERVLRDGVPASAAEERLVQQGLAARSAVLHRAYLVAALRRATEQWGDGSVHARADAEHWDFAPAAWGGHYWLRVRLNASGQARVLTMRRPLTPAEAADPDVAGHWQALDAERCAESSRYVDDLGLLSEAEGVRAEFAWTENGVLMGEPAPGLTDAFRSGATGGKTATTGRAGQTARTRRRRGQQPKYQQRDGQ